MSQVLIILIILIIIIAFAKVTNIMEKRLSTLKKGDHSDNNTKINTRNLRKHFVSHILVKDYSLVALNTLGKGMNPIILPLVMG